MSQKQLRKLQSLREAAAPAAPHASARTDDPQAEEEEEEVVTQEADVSPGPTRPPAFALLAGDDSDNSDTDSDGSDSELARPNASAPEPVVEKCKKSKRKKKPAKKVEEEAEENREEEDDDDAVLDAAVADAEAEEEADAAGGGDGEAALGSGVTLRRADFSVDAERRRTLGASVRAGDEARVRGPNRRLAVQARGGGEGRTAHHRRLFLVALAADEPWPKPDDAPVMSVKLDDSGAPLFALKDTASSERMLERVQDCLRSQDPQQLGAFLQQYAFCLDGLLTMAEFYRGRSEHEQAFKLVRRAVYIVECSFNAGFAPFQETGIGPQARRPRCRLQFSDELTWPGWSWLRALWMYMQGLAAQGMHRTSLEVAKLLLAVSLPRDPTHVLFAIDFLCLRSRQYDTLAQLSAHLAPQYGLQPSEDGSAAHCLDHAFPNFAYSVALAGLQKCSTALPLTLLNEVSIADVIPTLGVEAGPESVEAPAGAEVPARLMRAMLLFPLALRPLLEEAGAPLYGAAPPGSPSRETWVELLARPPFSDAADFRHERHAVALANACALYAKRCGPLWRGDLTLKWLHACAARLAGMHDSAVFAADLTAARTAWKAAAMPAEEALAADYLDILPTEGMADNPSTPPSLDRAAQARLHPPHDYGAGGEGFVGGGPGFGGGGAVAEVPPTVSLHSPPLLVFFQTLLPWAELDKSGVRVQPLSWGGLVVAAWGGTRGAAVSTAQALWELAIFAGALAKEGVDALKSRAGR